MLKHTGHPWFDSRSRPCRRSVVRVCRLPFAGMWFACPELGVINGLSRLLAAMRRKGIRRARLAWIGGTGRALQARGQSC